jgi:hypothetical protein
MDLSKITIKTKSGPYSFLDKKYRECVEEFLIENDENKNKWITYEKIFNEFISMKEKKVFDEFKYRFTGGESPNLVLIDIILKYPKIKEKLFFYIDLLKQYNYEENMKRFFN